MKNTLLQNIQNEGFYFSKFYPNRDFLNNILKNDAPNKTTMTYVREILSLYDFGQSKIDLVFEDVHYHESNSLHTHLIPCDFIVLIWAPKQDFLGREFLYGTKDKIVKFKPQFGDICFMKTNDLNFVHGVEKLKTKTLVRTLIAYINNKAALGEHVTVDLKTKQPI